LTEVFDHFDVETNRCPGVATHEQILNEGDENYAKVVSRYSLTGKNALEDLLDHGETRDTLNFQGPATLPPAPISSQMQTQIRAAESSPLHNYHLFIFAPFALFYADLARAATQMFGAQVAGFIEAQASAIDRHQKRAMLWLGYSDAEQALDLLTSIRLRPAYLSSDSGQRSFDMVKRPLQHPAVKESQTADDDIESAGRLGCLQVKVQQVGSDFFVAQRVWRTTIPLGQSRHSVNISFLGFGRVTSQGKLLDQAFP